MLIAGIRRKVGSELDERRSGLFLRYLVHFSQSFAFLGLMISIVIAIDYYCVPFTKDEVISNRYYKVTDNLNRTEYHFFTSSCRFLSDVNFYEKTSIGDNVTIYRTPIFNTITNVSRDTGQRIYTCKPMSIYGWPFIVVGLTFICSVIMVFRTWGWMKKRVHKRYDSVVNLGIINSILCIITLIAIFFHIPY